MLIDWFTVCAQAVNFLILVALLRRFLYRPVLDAIDAREAKIAAEISDADAKKADAAKARDEFLHKNEEFDKQRADLLAKATTAASAERKRLFGLAREDSDELRAKQQAALISEQARLKGEVSRRTRDEVFAISRKALADLASAGLEDQMAGVVVRRLRAATDPEKAAIRAALGTPGAAPTVRSTFDLAPAVRAEIEAAIQELIKFDGLIRYETSPEIVSGIEVSTDGWKVGWSIDGYLGSLEKDVDALLKPSDKLAPKPHAKPHAKKVGVAL